MKKSIKIIGGIITGALLVGAALLSKDDEIAEREVCTGEIDDSIVVEDSYENEEIIDTTCTEVEA